MDLPKSPALSKCASPYSSRHLMVKNRSPGVHRVAALQSRTMSLRSTDWNRPVGETVKGRAGARTSRLRSRAPISKTVEVTPPDRRRAPSTCSGLKADFRAPGCVRGDTASNSTSSTACSSARIGGGAGRACHHSTAPPPAAAPSEKTTKVMAGCRHMAGIFSSNDGRVGPTCSFSAGCWAPPSSGSCTYRAYAPPASRDRRRQSDSHRPFAIERRLAIREPPRPHRHACLTACRRLRLFGSAAARSQRWGMIADARSSSAVSSPGRPTSCTPTGRPFGPASSGRLMVGVCSRVHALQKIGSPV